MRWRAEAEKLDHLVIATYGKMLPPATSTSAGL
jgi:hypothetical protein